MKQVKDLKVGDRFRFVEPAFNLDTGSLERSKEFSEPIGEVYLDEYSNEVCLYADDALGTNLGCYDPDLEVEVADSGQGQLFARKTAAITCHGCNSELHREVEEETGDEFWVNSVGMFFCRWTDSGLHEPYPHQAKKADLEDLQEAQEEEDERQGEIDDSEVTPMTTRPHQLPGNGEVEERFEQEGAPGFEEEDEEDTDAKDSSDFDFGDDTDDDSGGDPDTSGSDDSAPSSDSGSASEAALIPVKCEACSRRFSVSKVAVNMRCICGSDDLDLDTKTALEVDNPSPEVPAPGGAVGDLPSPPLQTPVSSDQPEAGELPENQQFGEPFYNEDGERTEVEAKVFTIAKDIYKTQGVPRPQAFRLARRVVDGFPVVEDG